jgi:hypothetical protein
MHLIPLEEIDGDNRERIVIGHNIAYDRIRVREQYYRLVCCFDIYENIFIFSQIEQSFGIQCRCILQFTALLMINVIW